MRWVAIVLALAGASAAATAEPADTCATALALSPTPTQDELGSGLANTAKVQACDGTGCTTVMTVPAGRRVWSGSVPMSADCKTGALELIDGEDSDAVELWMIDVGHGTAARSAEFRGDWDHGSGRWMGTRYVYLVPGPLTHVADLYDPSGHRTRRITASALAASDDGRFLLGYPGENRRGDRRITLWDLRTMKRRVLAAHPRGAVLHDAVTWTSSSVEVPLSTGTRQFALPD